MNRLVTLLTVILIAGVIAFGCSKGKDAPTVPVVDPPVTPTSDLAVAGSGTSLLGYYEIYFDVETGTFEAVENRTAAFTLNIVPFLNQMTDPLYGISFGSIVVHDDDPSILGVDVEFKVYHPLAGISQYDVYDLLGVIIGDGADTLDYQGLSVARQGTDLWMKNADGFTRWFNPSEFTTELIFGYAPGGYQNLKGNAELNPYKYYAKGLSKAGDVWQFLNGTNNDGLFAGGDGRTMELEFPMPPEGIGLKFGYAIVVAWEEQGPTGPYLPVHRPEPVGAEVVVTPDVWYDPDTGDSGGDLILDIDLFAWEIQPSKIKIESTVLNGVAEFDAGACGVPQNDYVTSYHVEAPAKALSSIEGHYFWVIAEYTNHDYSNDMPGIPHASGPLAAFFRYDLPILDENPGWIEVLTPNGGEEWVCGTDEEITWDSYNVTGTVFIEYSKDNFVSDLHTIATDEANDGSFMWEDIPFDPSDTVRVRISSTDDPVICDISDADFTILQAFITLLIPNGGEEWKCGADEEITWTSENVSGTLFIEYSKDNFVSDIHSIAVDEPNDSSFMWEDIPNDLSTTVRVRVSSTDDPSVFDTSDADFSIVSSGWARTWGGSGADYSHDIALDGSGNVYVTGRFRGTVDFDPGSGVDNHSSNGGDDIYLTKFDSSGSFLWAKTWGGSGAVDVGDGIAIDGSGNVYVCGRFSLSFDFDPGSGVDNHSSNGGYDVYLSKFDSSGSFLWAKTWGGTSTDIGYGVGADGSDVYVIGAFVGTVDFDPGSGVENHSSNGSYDHYLSKFDSSGNHQWAKTWGGTSSDYAYTVIPDGSGNLYLTGIFAGTVDFDPSTGVDIHSSHGSYDVFLSKFDTSGTFLWAKTWGGTSVDRGYVVTADGSDVYVTGYFSNTVDFDPGSGVDNHATNGGYDVFLSKFNSSGSFLWAKTWGGSNADIGYSVAPDGSGNVYVVGHFNGIVDFDPGSGVDNHSSNGSDDVFMSKFDSSGSFLWASTWGGSASDSSYGVTADGSETVFVTGYFTGAVDFAPTDPPCNNDPDEHTSNGGRDVFLTKHFPDGCW